MTEVTADLLPLINAILAKGCRVEIGIEQGEPVIIEIKRKKRT